MEHTKILAQISHFAVIVIFCVLICAEVVDLNLLSSINNRTRMYGKSEMGMISNGKQATKTLVEQKLNTNQNRIVWIKIKIIFRSHGIVK